jgi:hypothetical protein
MSDMERTTSLVCKTRRGGSWVLLRGRTHCGGGVRHCPGRQMQWPYTNTPTPSDRKQPAKRSKKQVQTKTHDRTALGQRMPHSPAANGHLHDPTPSLVAGGWLTPTPHTMPTPVSGVAHQISYVLFLVFLASELGARSRLRRIIYYLQLRGWGCFTCFIV